MSRDLTLPFHGAHCQGNHGNVYRSRRQGQTTDKDRTASHITWKISPYTFTQIINFFYAPLAWSSWELQWFRRPSIRDKWSQVLRRRFHPPMSLYFKCAVWIAKRRSENVERGSRTLATLCIQHCCGIRLRKRIPSCGSASRIFRVQEHIISRQARWIEWVIVDSTFGCFIARIQD